jgi:hypothetical protein
MRVPMIIPFLLFSKNPARKIRFIAFRKTYQLKTSQDTLKPERIGGK